MGIQWGATKQAVEGMIGRKLREVTLDADKDLISFSFLEGPPTVFTTEGDWCSSSWIEHLEKPGDLTGATLTGVREAEMEPWDKHVCPDELPGEYHRTCGHDCLSVYHTVFSTDRGDIVLEYRNNSNGYYGGSLEVFRPGKRSWEE